jgi:hypothetical protein
MWVNYDSVGKDVCIARDASELTDQFCDTAKDDW